MFLMSSTHSLTTKRSVLMAKMHVTVLVCSGAMLLQILAFMVTPLP
jgi:hypothetical protein